jgi:hypothetical protein
VIIRPFSRLLIIIYFIEVGLILIVVPWSGFWERNFFAASLPALDDVIRNNFIRGAVSGLGIVNLWAGLVELAALLSRRGVTNSAREVST